ncbi:hypothetical protein, partial [Aeromonas sanarellii]|uniref:hypothetical protein n=1 Tax=Aeromonas sanarellii TaxID=633415 RepID=UPI0038D16AFA
MFELLLNGYRVAQSIADGKTGKSASKLVYGDGIHLTVAHKREWSYGFKPDNKTVPLPCYLESPYDHQRE